MSELPETLEELCDYIVRYASGIYVRVQDPETGKWGNRALAELPTPQALEVAMRFVKTRRVPVRVREDSEL